MEYRWAQRKDFNKTAGRNIMEKKKKTHKRSRAKLWALMGVGFMVLSTIAYAVISNPTTGEQKQNSYQQFIYSNYTTKDLQAMEKNLQSSYVNGGISLEEYKQREENLQKAMEVLKSREQKPGK
ncbi:hypothetical protein BMS3Bbin15_01469 [archaeon BMS3Bbin15]|nr:hypothetical protein BMS3Bbin15_01469 [archaeon BMS3Bbin15]